MDDVKKTYREGEQETKEAWRKADGDESACRQGRERRRRDPQGPRQRGRRRQQRRGTDSADASKEAWRKADGDESLADKIGNAGDDMRRTMDDPR